MTNTSKNIEFHVLERKVSGKKVKQLRENGYIPANIYGLGKDSQLIQCDQKKLQQLLKSHGDQGLLYLVLDGQEKSIPVLMDEVVVHPVSAEPLHVVFRRVSLKTKIETEVEIEVVGEVDIKNAVVEQTRDSLPIEALPADIPESIQVDISGLTQVGDSILVSQLQIDTSKIKIMLSEEELEGPIVVVQEIQEEVEPEEVETAEEGTEQAAPESTEETSSEDNNS